MANTTENISSAARPSIGQMESTYLRCTHAEYVILRTDDSVQTAYHQLLNNYLTAYEARKKTPTEADRKFLTASDALAYIKVTDFDLQRVIPAGMIDDDKLHHWYVLTRHRISEPQSIFGSTD